jgi:hypothetical protein
MRKCVHESHSIADLKAFERSLHAFTMPMKTGAPDAGDIWNRRRLEALWRTTVIITCTTACEHAETMYAYLEARSEQAAA